MKKQLRLLFLSNHFITLYAFRKEIIKRSLSEGYDVYLSLPDDKDNVYFETLGCKTVLTDIERRGMNPIKDIRLLVSYFWLLKKIKPDIIFSFTIKPNVYGSMASRILGVRQICNITGTGAVFLEDGFVNRLCKLLYRISIKYCYKVFFQNEGDQKYFVLNNLVKDNYELIPGSGVNLEEHPYTEMPPTDHIRFIYIGRVMKLKGIDEYLECAQAIRRKYPQTTFYIAGWNEEPAYMEKVNEAQKRGDVEYLGFRKDIKMVIEKCHCIIHPAHGGEGISNVLLECAAMGRVCIASDIYGCKEIIDDRTSGFLFKAGDAKDLTDKVEQFVLLSAEEKQQMGKNGREMVTQRFDRDIVVEKYMKEIYSLRNE